MSATSSPRRTLGSSNGRCQAGGRSGKVYAVQIAGVAGLAEHPTQPDMTFLDELRGRVRVIACLDEAPIAIGSATMPEFPEKHIILERIRKRIHPGENDDFFIVFGPEGRLPDGRQRDSHPLCRCDRGGA